MTREENYLKAVRFEKPDYIPMTFSINGACWHHYEQERLFELMEAHPFLFPNYRRPEGVYTPALGSNQRKDTPYTDDFGCIWTTTDDGITGTVTGHPLSDWDAFDEWKKHIPDPNKCMGIGAVDWEAEKKHIASDRLRGGLSARGLRHGHTFMQLCDIRGYENVLFDMTDGEPRFLELLDIVALFNQYIVDKYVSLGVGQMGYAEDLGMQSGPMVPPALFVKYLKPVYKRFMAPAVEKGLIVHMHSDGDIRTLADELVDSGVTILNLQDLVNGIDWIKEKYAGKICIDLDIDRQRVTRFGSPADVDALIREEVVKLGSKAGGLMMIYGMYPDIPLENAKALMDAMETYAMYYS